MEHAIISLIVGLIFLVAGLEWHKKKLKDKNVIISIIEVANTSLMEEVEQLSRSLAKANNRVKQLTKTPAKPSKPTARRKPAPKVENNK